MSRLTKKLTTNSNYEIQLLQRGLTYVTNTPYNEQIIDKLGQLEDLEDELGCPLEVVFKALKQGYIYVDMGIFEFPKIKDIQKQEVNFVNFGGKYFHIGYTSDYSLALCDYSKTWWLKGDRSE